MTRSECQALLAAIRDQAQTLTGAVSDTERAHLEQIARLAGRVVRTERACLRLVELVMDTLAETIADLSLSGPFRYRAAHLRNMAERHLIQAGVLS